MMGCERPDPMFGGRARARHKSQESILVPHSVSRPEPPVLRPPQNGRMLRPGWTQVWTQFISPRLLVGLRS
jgi:hypothetical protein